MQIIVLKGERIPQTASAVRRKTNPKFIAIMEKKGRKLWQNAKGKFGQCRITEMLVLAQTKVQPLVQPLPEPTGDAEMKAPEGGRNSVRFSQSTFPASSN